ncbi:MAG TPA: TonB-dependent receptor [Burkholderiaceae bacterium]|nr:TonB-dependent receptor [Burkholderiaceae bacterium]
MGPATGLAQTPPTERTLDAVVITATRTPSRVSDAIAEITVLDRAALDRSSGRTLTELLSQQAGMQFYSNGGLGKVSSLSMRGLDARHTLLLVDGVRVGSATLGTPSLDNLPLESIDRIEIVRGPLSGLYGSDAVGGVVQIFTRRGRDGFRPNLKVTAGSERYAQLAGGFTLGQDGWDAAVQLEHTETHGFSATNSTHPFSYDPDRDPFRQHAGSARFGYRLNADWRIEARVLHADALNDYDDGIARLDADYMPLPGPGAHTQARLRNRVLASDLSGAFTPEWHTALRVSTSDDEAITVDANGPDSLGKIATERRLLGWEHTVALPLGQLFAAAERLLEDVSKPPPQYDITSRQVDALSLGWNGTVADHSWQASARRDRNSQFGNQNTGAVAWGYAVTPAWRAGASFGSSFVAPSFNQLYWPGFGNPALQPEEGKHAELSLRFSQDSRSARAAWFRHRVGGYITPGARPGNIDAHIDGVSLSCDTRLDDWVLNASLDRMDPQVANGSNAGKQLPRRAKSALKLQADWTRGDLSGGLAWQALSQRFDDAANKNRLPGYGTLDLRADWRVASAWTLGARLNNVADKVYETARGYNQPGREVFVTLRFAPT